MELFTELDTWNDQKQIETWNEHLNEIVYEDVNKIDIIVYGSHQQPDVDFEDSAVYCLFDGVDTFRK